MAHAWRVSEKEYKLWRPFLNESLAALIVVSSVLVVFIGHSWPPSKTSAFEYFVVLYFGFEFIAKIRVGGTRDYFQKNTNCFDFFVLMASVFVLMIPSLTIGTAIYLRALRLIGMLRMIRLVPNAGQILEGLWRALSAARAVIFFMFIIMVVFAIIGHSLFKDDLPLYFGTPLTALNTVFGIFTIENWGAIPQAAAELGSDTLFYAVNTFVITVLIVGGFIALSLANAIFVDEMVSDNNDVVMQRIDSIEAKLDRLLQQRQPD